MNTLTSLVFLISLAGPAAADLVGLPDLVGIPVPLATVPGPEMTAGIMGMTLAASVVYLIKRRGKRS